MHIPASHILYSASTKGGGHGTFKAKLKLRTAQGRAIEKPNRELCLE